MAKIIQTHLLLYGIILVTLLGIGSYFTLWVSAPVCFVLIIAIPGFLTKYTWFGGDDQKFRAITAEHGIFGYLVLVHIWNGFPHRDHT
ncbi:hypothetical protein [Rhizobium sp. BK376]|uniref:hypothetical protein n=1 Tax=Rhizobium sp. BK376 TaxID=2512149 RepID=UPI00104D1AF4|nr:hypothetical protein [Rhizobium sp. BK376]TCR83782.1 hypothetical protein EV561_1086 [Rhizobium sp. BK376]